MKGKDEFLRILSAALSKGAGHKAEQPRHWLCILPKGCVFPSGVSTATPRSQDLTGVKNCLFCRSW